MSRPDRSPRTPRAAEPPTCSPRGNVFPIDGWLEAMSCPQCRSEEVLQVDVVECTYPVRGVRRPWGFVAVDVAASRLDPASTHAEFFRCDDCLHEWPVEPGTRFVEAEEAEDPPG